MEVWGITMNEDEKQLKKHRKIVHKYFPEIKQFIKLIDEAYEEDKIRFSDAIIGHPNITCYLPTIFENLVNKETK